MRWLTLQLADGAFPTGGFAHSAGLEAAVQLGAVRSSADALGFTRVALWQLALGVLPFVAAAFDAPGDLPAVDAAADGFLLGEVANRASRTQGRAFAAAVGRVFPEAPLVELAERARRRELAAHHGPVFGAALAHLGVPRGDALALYLHGGVRTVLSAAVRLNVLGPHEAQGVQHDLAPELTRALDEGSRRPAERAAQPAPFYDLLAAQQDGLYARLFQS